MGVLGVDDPTGAPELDETTLTIGEDVFRYWESIQLSLAMDAFWTASFTAPFESERAAMRDTFRPFQYKPCEVAIGDETIFTGTMVDISPSVSATKRSVEVACYAVPGVLGDVMSPKANWPVAFENVTLRQIAETLLAPFGISVEYFAEPSGAFKEVKLEEAKTIFSFLSELAKQRNLVLTNDDLGNVIFQRSVPTGNPVAEFLFDEGGRDPLDPLPKVSATFAPQAYYSEITGMVPAKKGRKGSSHTVQNTFLPDVLRPHSFKLDDTEPGDAPEMTMAKLGRMFGNMATYEISDIPTLRDPSGELWKPNTTISLRSPDAMIYNTTEFVIRTVEFSITPSKKSATLGLVLPGAFSGELPDSLPWEE